MTDVPAHQPVQDPAQKPSLQQTPRPLKPDSTPFPAWRPAPQPAHSDIEGAPYPDPIETLEADPIANG